MIVKVPVIREPVKVPEKWYAPALPKSNAMEFEVTLPLVSV